MLGTDIESDNVLAFTTETAAISDEMIVKDRVKGHVFNGEGYNYKKLLEEASY